MFNENIDDKVDVPSMGVLKLWFVLQDMNLPNYNYTPVDMQNLMNHYGDKYTHIDKVIMLIYGVSTVKSYTLNEEKIDKARVNPKDLTDREKQTDSNELITPQVILDTNIGELVIGYDYAYVKKPIYTPNVELSDKDIAVSTDERIIYNINYPYIFIDCHNETLKVIPPIDYDTYITTLGEQPTASDHWNSEAKQRGETDSYIIDIKTLDMRHIYSRQPFDSNDGELTDKITKALGLSDYTFDCNFIIKSADDNGERLAENIYLVQQYKQTNGGDKLYQLIIDNHYNVYNIYWQNSGYICEKLYLKSA